MRKLRMVLSILRAIGSNLQGSSWIGEKDASPPLILRKLLLNGSRTSYIISLARIQSMARIMLMEMGMQVSITTTCLQMFFLAAASSWIRRS